jgi:aminoglycoside phosphotransferase (APT) family kinase protein
MPAAELEITAGLVRRLVEAQHTDLAGLPVEPLANGWDNTLFRLGDELVARLPRRALGAVNVVNEQRWLPALAPRLPVPVPVPVRTGAPGEGYPWPWSITAFLPGTPAADGPPFDPRQAAADLGGFFGALHAAAPPDAPANPYRGVPLAQRSANLKKNLETVAGQVDQGAVLAVWAAALAAPVWDGAPVWLHGDPHPANVLISDGKVSGVIDFGDVTSGDPASDLSLAWMLLPAACHGRFRAAYAAAGHGPVTDAMWARGRGWALNLAIVFLAFSADNLQLHAVGERTLAAVLDALSAPASRCRP